MSIASALKCLFCLIKCSKYLYYAKKAVCIIFIGVAVFASVALLSGDSRAVKKLKEML